MELRPYQSELVAEVRKEWRRGKKAPCIVLPCGGGKSCIVAEIARRTTENHNRVLFLVHRKELVEQIKNTFNQWGVNMNLCDVMMVQTASRKIKMLKPPILIITDENHHSKANTYRKIYDSFPQAYRIGVTATPIRLDGSGLQDVNDVLVVGVSAKWLIEHKCLAPYDYYAPAVADMSDVAKKRGEFDSASAEKILLEKKVFGDVIHYYMKYAGKSQAVCYCTTVKHSLRMAEEFSDAGIEAAHIDGTTPKAERERIINDFRRGAIDILCNVDLISEGFDVPDCGCVIMLRPTQSLTLYIQQSMRCMRYREGKRAVILDHVGNYARFGLPDADRTWTLEGKLHKGQYKAPEEVHIKECPKCYAVIAPEESKCPHCGYEFPKRERNEIESEPAELKKIEGFVLDFKTPAECQSYAELLEYAKTHGYKKGWAWYQAKERGLIA